MEGRGRMEWVRVEGSGAGQDRAGQGRAGRVLGWNEAATSTREMGRKAAFYMYFFYCEIIRIIK
ncbi:hypothetical protein E2C01_093701 [Portunus trituberculatus]|uniref:Uncharacterized protein n=1 Tax=Portunus trituberculatus TaxID=210409 RepID=A0A5B7JUW6_PORTR|nr:hypothetical protein [Portunus trituberculatus]